MPKLSHFPSLRRRGASDRFRPLLGSLGLASLLAMGGAGFADTVPARRAVWWPPESRCATPLEEVRNLRMRCGAGGEIESIWEPVACAVCYHLYMGSIDVFGGGPPSYDHDIVLGGCALVTAPALLDPAAVSCGDGRDVYFLIVAQSFVDPESSYGRDSAGTPRPAALNLCGGCS